MKKSREGNMSGINLMQEKNIIRMFYFFKFAVWLFGNMRRMQ